MDRLAGLARITVAVVDGRVQGGGVGIAAACDLVAGTPRAEFALPEALWALLPCSVLPFLLRRVGPQFARTMTLTTQPVPAGDALRHGLLDVLEEDPWPWVHRVAARAERLDGAIVAEAKRYLDVVTDSPRRWRELAVGEFARLLRAPAAQERIAGFAGGGRMPWDRAAGR
jgi:polyketide biosynthesis enoyl-CoA hydratase PksH